MDYLRSYYTLEKHLESTAQVNPNFEVLNAVWKLNKQTLSSALINVNQYFPHYSLHEISHSNTIISNIELLLGEERIKKLSPTNTWLILMAAYTHDLGMLVFQELVENQWQSDDFQDFLEDMCNADNYDLKSSAELLSRIQKIDYSEDRSQMHSDNEGVSPVKVKNALILIVSEYIRKIHHKRSSDMLKGMDKQFFELAHSFYSHHIPNRLLNVLGEVAYLHGVNFYKIFDRLEFESIGVSNDTINPRFIACLLRLGDLLDIDDKRFNAFTQKVFPLPESSKYHVDKHASIKHLLITPESIEIISDCPDENVYRLARQWFDWLEQEVSLQNKEWSNIAPANLGGAAPAIPKGKIKVYFKSQEVDDSLLNLRFTISNRKIFEILSGSTIYENAEMVFIRELIQNALDASKIQLWDEVNRGTFDFLFRNLFKDSKLSHDEIISRIEFPDDIPAELEKIMSVGLNLRWKDTNQDVLEIEVVDNGTGISEENLIKLTSEVGENRKKDNTHKRKISSMPFWLKPTGAFGIGLQSVFTITNKFTIITKVDGEKPKKITLRSSKNGDYCSVEYLEDDIKRGTKVIVEVPKTNFSEIFGSTFDLNIIANYDYFNDSRGGIHLHKVENYIKRYLSEIRNLKVNFFGEDIPISDESDTNILPLSSKKTEKIKGELYVYENLLIYRFYEKIIGSEFQLFFETNFDDQIKNNQLSSSIEYLVRDVRVVDSSGGNLRLPCVKLIWNLMSPESDKILNLSREKLVAKTKYNYQNEFFKKILPHALSLCEEMIIEANGIPLDKPSLSVIYFKLRLLRLINKGEDSIIPSLEKMDHEYLPTEVVSNCDGERVSILKFFNSKFFIVPLNSKQNWNDLKGFLSGKFDTNEFSSDHLLLYRSGFLQKYLLENYYISKLYYSESDLDLIVLSKEESKIKISGAYKSYLRSILVSNAIPSRGNFYVAEKYYNRIAVINDRISGFEYFPLFSRTSIISPFYSKSDYLKIRNTLEQDSSKKIPDIVKEIIPIKLIRWIIEKKPHDVQVRREEDVYEAYAEIIQELIDNDID